MKALPPGPEPITLDTQGTGLLWVVFEVGTRGSALHLTEVAKVRAGSEAAAIVSTAESGKFRKSGRLVAFPVERLHGGRVQPHYFVNFD